MITNSCSYDCYQMMKAKFISALSTFVYYMLTTFLICKGWKIKVTEIRDIYLMQNEASWKPSLSVDDKDWKLCKKTGQGCLLSVQFDWVLWVSFKFKFTTGNINKLLFWENTTYSQVPMINLSVVINYINKKRVEGK